MAKKLKRASEGHLTSIIIRLPGSVKNDLIRVARKNRVSMTAWVVETIRRGIREEWGIPEPPPAVAPLPTPADLIESAALNRPVITPCGKVGVCEGTGLSTVDHNGMSFCSVCQIRVV